ncbi:MAG TPA: DNA repair protein RadC [Actinomycetes bacterium]
MTVRILDLPEQERPRERLWHHGTAALSTIELLALVLRQGCTGQSAVELAAALLAEHGSLAGLAAAAPEELAGRPGMGPAKAAALLAALRLGRCFDAGDAPLTVRRPEDLALLARQRLGGLRRERVLVVVLDPGHRVRRVVQVSDGSADHCLLPVREVLNAVLRNDGSAFALVHNHPSGDPTPSQADLRATERLASAARIVDLRLVDHLVTTDHAWASVRAARARRATSRL